MEAQEALLGWGSPHPALHSMGLVFVHVLSREISSSLFFAGFFFLPVNPFCFPSVQRMNGCVIPTHMPWHNPTGLDWIEVKENERRENNESLLPQSACRICSVLVPSSLLTSFLSGSQEFVFPGQHKFPQLLLALGWGWKRERKQEKGTWTSHSTQASLHPKGLAFHFWWGRRASLGVFPAYTDPVAVSWKKRKPGKLAITVCSQRALTSIVGLSVVICFVVSLLHFRHSKRRRFLGFLHLGWWIIHRNWSDSVFTSGPGKVSSVINCSVRTVWNHRTDPQCVMRAGGSLLPEKNAKEVPSVQNDTYLLFLIRKMPP